MSDQALFVVVILSLIVIIGAMIVTLTMVARSAWRVGNILVREAWVSTKFDVGDKAVAVCLLICGVLILMIDYVEGFTTEVLACL